MWMLQSSVLFYSSTLSTVLLKTSPLTLQIMVTQKCTLKLSHYKPNLQDKELVYTNISLLT